MLCSYVCNHAQGSVRQAFHCPSGEHFIVCSLVGCESGRYGEGGGGVKGEGGAKVGEPSCLH